MDYGQARRNMVDCQLRTFDVTDRAVLAAMEEVPREAFVPAGQESLAYLDRAVPLTAGAKAPRCLLPPMVLARLVQALGVRVPMRVLDVACGSGYSSAVLARLGAEVTALEADAETAGSAQTALRAYGEGRVLLRTGALDKGCADRGPFDGILINGSLETEPDNLFEQLADGGRLVCLRHDARGSRAMMYLRSGEAIGSRVLFDAASPVLSDFQAPPAFVF